MQRLLWLALAGVIGLGAAQAGETAKPEGENPYRRAKVGDWTRHEGTTLAPMGGGERVEARSRMFARVTEKTDAEATVARVFSLTTDGHTRTRPAHYSSVDLARAHEPLESFIKRLPDEAKVEKGLGGEETVKAAGRDWRCTIHVVKVSNPASQMEGVLRLWHSPEAPLSGMVRMDSQMDFQAGDQKIHNESSLLLVAFGTATNPDPEAPALDNDEEDDAKQPAGAAKAETEKLKAAVDTLKTEAEKLKADADKLADEAKAVKTDAKAVLDAAKVAGK